MSIVSLKRVVVLPLLLCFLLAGFNTVEAAEGSARPKGAVIVIEKDKTPQFWKFRTAGKAGTSMVLLTLRTADNKPITGKKITGEVLMPEMPMAGYPMPLEFIEDKPGEYSSLARYMHGGFWRVSVKVPSDANMVLQDSFDFDLAD